MGAKGSGGACSYKTKIYHPVNTNDHNTAYVDSSKVKQNDINFFVQVKVINQQLVADDVTKLNAIANVPANNDKRFTDIMETVSFLAFWREGNSMPCYPSRWMIRRS